MDVLYAVFGKRCETMSEKSGRNTACLRAAVVTLAGRFNYGNRLQAYAVQRVLEPRVRGIVTLEFVGVGPVRASKDALKLILGRSTPSREDLMTPARREAFQEFQDRIETREASLVRRGFVPEYDLFVTGSDQVWNPRFMAYGKPELLEFAPEGKRIAMAASVGVRDIERKYRRRFARALRGFAHLSVREEAAADLVEGLIGRRPEVLVDPTLMLGADKWREVASDRLVPDEPYVFCYCLGDDGGIVSAACRRMGEACGATRVIRISDRDAGDELPAGPQDFVSLIGHASAVVTDSYHGSIFSAIFGRPLCVLRREDPMDMFSRIETLIGSLGLEGCLASGTDADWDALAQGPDYGEVARRLEVRRRDFDAFLDEALAGAGGAGLR